MMVIGREGEIIGISRTELWRHETLQNYNFFALSYKQSGKYCGGRGRKMLIINPRLQECLGDAGFNKFILIGDSMLTTIYVLHTDHIALSMLRVV